ncbi:MAG: four helix bundle protein [Balneolaceae bacterium]|nr:four helix bundle protein [Balneolaceae bacterium]
MNKKKKEINSFEDLEVWQVGRTIRKDIFELVKKFPDLEKYRLIDQMIRSSRSICDNISEGYGRFHYQENIQFCRVSRGSAYELINHLLTAYDCLYISDTELNDYRKRITRCIRLINGYIGYLHRAKSASSTSEEPISYTPNYTQ